MPKINLLRQALLGKQAAAAVVEQEPLIDMDYEVHTIIMRRDSEIFYMVDMNDDGTWIQWSRLRDDAVQFITKDDAVSYLSLIKKTGRQNLHIDSFKKELELLELDFEF